MSLWDVCSHLLPQLTQFWLSPLITKSNCHGTVFRLNRRWGKFYKFRKKALIGSHCDLCQLSPHCREWEFQAHSAVPLSSLTTTLQDGGGNAMWQVVRCAVKVVADISKNGIIREWDKRQKWGDMAMYWVHACLINHHHRIFRLLWRIPI